MSIAAALSVARRYASGGPVTRSPAQVQAGNYKMKHITFQGIPISIENPKGTVRSGIDSNGKPWSNRMAADYGYIKRTEGKDGDQVDAFVGPFRNSDHVFIIDQLHHHMEKFDEHKCLLGFNTKKQALTAYHRSYGRVYGHHHTVGAVTELSIDAFKEWLKGGGGKEPVAPDVPKYQDGGLVFDPDYLKSKPQKTPNIRVTEGHQEFEKGYAPSGRSPWNTDYPYRPILNTRGQELDALKIQEGGTVDDSVEDVPGVGPVPTSTYPELAKIPVGLAREQAEFVAQPRQIMESKIPQMPETGEWTEEQEYLRQAGLAQQAQKEAEFGQQASLATFGTGAFGAQAGALGIAGGKLKTPVPGIEKAGSEAVHHWSQAIADTLLEKHGTDIEAIENSLNGLHQATSDRAATAIFAKLPEDIQFELAMRDMHPQLREPLTESDIRYNEMREQGLLPSQQPQAPAFREITHPAEARDWLRERGYSPEDMGFKDPESYVVKANELKRREAGLTTSMEDLEEAEPQKKPINLDEVFGLASPLEVKHFSTSEIRSLRDQLSAAPNPEEYKIIDQKLWNVLHQRFDELDRTQAIAASWSDPVQLSRARPQPVPAGPFAQTYDPQGYQRFSDYFNEVLGKHVGSQENFVKDFFGGMNTSQVSAHLTMDPYHYGTPALRFEGPLIHPNGDSVGSVDRTIVPEQKYAYHGLLALHGKYQGGEIAPRILRNQIDLYKALDLDYVKLRAGLEGGPYAWAKYGWIPEQYNWNLVRNDTKRLLADGHLKVSDPDTRSVLMAILNDNDPRALWDLSDITAKDDFGNEIGKAALLGREMKGGKNLDWYPQGWSGQLNLKNAESMERFDAYYKRQIERAGKKKPRPAE